MNAPGRRVEISVSARRTALFSATVVALTAGMLALAGTTPREIGRAVEDPSRVLLDSRTFSCAGGISGSTVRTGSVRAGLGAARAVPDGAPRPVTVVTEQEVAGSSFAGQQASSRSQLAWVPCPEPAARWWFVGAGGAENTHDTVLTITNPRPGEARVDIEVFGPGGPVEAPAFRDVPVPPRSSTVIDLARTAPALGNLAVSVTARRGLVAVSAADRFAPGSVGTFTREWLPPQPVPSRTLNLVGLPAQRSSSSLIVANPGDAEAIVKVQVIGQTGTFVPEALGEFSVDPGAVRSVPLGAVLDGSPSALRITSEQRVTATVRSIRDGDSSFATGARVVYGATAFAVPDGSARLMLSSVREGTQVRVTAFGSRSQELVTKELGVGAESTAAVALPSGTRYVRLFTEGPEVVAGFVVSGRNGTAAAAVGSAVRSVQLPAIRANF